MNLSSLLGMILGLLALAYFASAPFRVRVNAEVRDRTQWTAASIERNPAGYLEWASGQYGRLLQELDAQRIQLSFEHSMAEKTMAFETKAIPEFQRRLEVAKEAYVKAEAAGTWPTQVEGEVFQRDGLVARIFLLHSSWKAAQERAEVAEKTIRIATTSMASLEPLRRDLQSGLNGLTSAKLLEGNRALTASSNHLGKQIQHVATYVGAVKTRPDAPAMETLVVKEVRGKLAEDNLEKILHE